MAKKLVFTLNVGTVVIYLLLAIDSTISIMFSTIVKINQAVWIKSQWLTSLHPISNTYMIEGKQIEIFIECFKENSNLTFNSESKSSKIHTLSVILTIKYKGQWAKRLTENKLQNFTGSKTCLVKLERLLLHWTEGFLLSSNWKIWEPHSLCF